MRLLPALLATALIVPGLTGCSATYDPAVECLLTADEMEAATGETLAGEPLVSEGIGSDVVFQHQCHYNFSSTASLQGIDISWVDGSRAEIEEWIVYRQSVFENDPLTPMDNAWGTGAFWSVHPNSGGDTPQYFAEAGGSSG